MICPNCNIDNPEGAVRCNCGYDFGTSTVVDSYSAVAAEKPSTPLLVIGWICSILGGWLGIVIACIITFSKNKQDKSQYKYDESSRKQGKIMLGIAIAMTVISIIRIL